MQLYRHFVRVATLVNFLASSNAQASDCHWHRLASISRGPRQEHTTVALGSSIYLLAGVIYDSLSNVQTVNLVDVFSTSTNTWSAAAPLPKPVNHANGAVFNGRIYVLGSLFVQNEEWDAIPDTWMYDPHNDTWTDLTVFGGGLPNGTARGASAVGVWGSKIYLAGGMTYLVPTDTGGQDAVGTVSLYDTATNTWDTSLPPLPEARQHVGGAVVNSTFYVLGGRTDGREKVRDTVFALNLEDTQAGWQTLAPMPTARGGLGCAALGVEIYCFGGENPDLGGYGVYKETEIYDTSSNSWEKGEDMDLPRHGMQVVGVDGRVYVPGGEKQQKKMMKQKGFFSDQLHLIKLACGAFDTTDRVSAMKWELRHANTPPSEKHFPFFELPAELRLRVYSYIVPDDQRIFLDPDNIRRPLPYTWNSHGSTKDLLLANKQIHAEAINFIFNRNIVNLIHPEDPRQDRFFNLGTSNHNCIRVLELHVPGTHLRGLEKQCAVMEKCPNLTGLRLVMYHDLSWQAMFAELAYYATTHDKDMCLDLEAYTSVVVLSVHIQQLEKSFRESLQRIATGPAVYDLKIPRHVGHITVTVSTTNDTAERLP
ncbi:hypothetical protein SCUP234_04752 [Seiridium cupressi]